MKKGMMLVMMVLMCGIVSAGVTDNFVADYSTPSTLVHESDGFLNNVSYYNSTWLELYDESDRITINNATKFDLGSSSMPNATWIFSLKVTDDNQSKVYYKQGTDNSSMQMYLTNVEKLAFDIGLDNNSVIYWYPAPFIAPDNLFTVALTFDSTDADLYVNGTLNDTQAVNTNLRKPDGTITIGREASLNYNGSVFDVYVFNRTLIGNHIYHIDDFGRNNRGVMVPCVTYHYIGDDGEYYTPRDLFISHMDYLDQEGFETITFRDFKNWKDYGNFTMPEKPIILVFDDGYKTTLNDASVIMDDYGYVGVTGVVTNLIGTGGNYMSWAEVGQLEDKGWEIASHGQTHTDMKTLTQSERFQEYNNSKRAIIGNLSYTPITWVFPYNSRNFTLTNESSSLFYEYTSGWSKTEDNNSDYLYKNYDLRHGWHRIGTTNVTSLSSFKLRVNPFDSLIMKYSLNENNATTAYDTSGNANHGTITGATYNNDGVKQSLTNTYDYTLSGSTFTLLDPYYDKYYLEGDFGCVTPGGTVTYSASTTMCRSTYYLNGSISLGASNIVLDCNGATLRGNNTNDGIQSNSRLNATIKNCNIYNYSKGIDVYQFANGLIFNNTVRDVQTVGIHVKELSNNATVLDCTIDGNTAQNALLAVNYGTNKTNIINNTITNSARNCVDLGGYYHNVSGNDIGTCDHVGIDMHDDDKEDGGYNRIFDNIVRTKGIHIFSQNNNDVFDNTVYREEISVEGNWSYCYDNVIRNNTIIEGNYSMWAGGCANTKWLSNSIQDSTYPVVYVSAFYLNYTQKDNSTFLDNEYTDGYAYYHLETDNITLSIKETSTLYHVFNFSNGAPVYMSGNFEKNVTIEDLSIQMYNLPVVNQIYNSSSAAPAYNNTAQLNTTLPSGGRLFVIKYDSANQPQPSSIATTVTDFTYTYDTSGRQLTITCEGTGNIVLNNMDQLLGEYDSYVHEVDGSQVETSSASEFTITSCSTHTFYGAVPSLSVTSPLAQRILRIGLGAFVALALVAFALLGYTKRNEWNTTQYMYYFVFMVIATVIIVELLKIVFSV